MGFIKRKWTAKEADEWRKEDWIAIIISPICYGALMIGTALSLLLLTVGFIILGAGLVLTALMYWVINPKLSQISKDYEKKQKHYIDELEKKANWEESNE